MHISSACFLLENNPINLAWANCLYVCNFLPNESLKSDQIFPNTPNSPKN